MSQQPWEYREPPEHPPTERVPWSPQRYSQTDHLRNLAPRRREGPPQAPPPRGPRPSFSPQPQRRPQPQRYARPQYQPPFQPNGYRPPSQYAPPPQYAPRPPQRQRRTARNVIASFGALIAVIIVISVAANSGRNGQTSGTSQGAAPAQSAVNAAAQAPAAQTVTYVVTGSDADVTYGPAGTELTGPVPMRVSQPLGTPAYYSIDAQLQGGGTVSCEILVDGSVISSATANGGYNIASCEIGQDPLSGQWQDDNG